MRPLLVAVIVFACGPAPAADLKPVVDPLVEPLTKDKPAVGLVVGVWADGKPHVFGYGKVTTPDGELVPDGDTLFEIGSITKAFTGVLLAEAVARGEVALKDPANKHLPKDFAIRPKTDKPVTLLHLATHHSGLAVQPPLIGLTARNKANPYADFTRPKLVKLMEQLKPQREPDAKYEYSNLGVGLLGHALVNAEKKQAAFMIGEEAIRDYDGLIRARITRWLDMNDTATALTGAQKARLARGHDEKLKPTDPWDFATLEACGGLRSSVNDMLKFAAANVGEGTFGFYPTGVGGGQVVRAGSAGFKPSHEKQASAGSDKMDVGLCWHRIKLKSGEPVVWHNGGTGGFRSMLAFTPGTKRAVVVLCAADLGQKVDKLAFQALEAVQPK